MPLIKEEYDEGQIENLKNYLQRESGKGRARDYEIIVDGISAVPRTSDVSEFDDYELLFRKDRTRTISILIYNGKSPRNTEHQFLLNTDNAVPAKPQNSLGSLGEVDQLIQQRLDEKDKVYQIQSLNEKLAAKQEELDEAIEYSDLLQQEIDQLKADKFKWNGTNLGELLSEVLKFTVHSNANKSPAMAQLSAVLGMLNGIDPPGMPQLRPPQEADAAATFKEKAPPGHVSVIAESIRKMQEALNGEQLRCMNSIMARLLEHPEQIHIVAELLNIKTERHD